MNAQRLQSEIAGMSPSDRITRGVQVARELQRSDPRALDGVLDDLSDGEVYARRLAVP